MRETRGESTREEREKTKQGHTVHKTAKEKCKRKREIIIDRTQTNICKEEKYTHVNR